MNRSIMRLYAVTDRRWLGEMTLAEQVRAALKGGVTCVQLREKHLDDTAFLAEAQALRRVCSAFGVPLLINDNVEIALRSGADGVHIGQGDMPLAEVRRILGKNKIIGVTAKTVAQALAAEEGGADYLGSGAMFSTSTKTDTSLLDRGVFRDICRSVHIPVVAIGGIDRQNMPELQGLGMDGFAMVSGIFAAPDITGECRRLRALADALVQPE